MGAHQPLRKKDIEFEFEEGELIESDEAVPRRQLAEWHFHYWEAAVISS